MAGPRERGIRETKQQSDAREITKNQAKMTPSQCKVCDDQLRALSDMMELLSNMGQGGIDVDSMEQERQRLVERFTLLKQYMSKAG